MCVERGVPHSALTLRCAERQRAWRTAHSVDFDDVRRNFKRLVCWGCLGTGVASYR